LNIDTTYCVIVAGASPGETKMWAEVRENSKFFALAVRITGNWETVEDRCVHAARQFVSNEFFFHRYNI